MRSAGSPPLGNDHRPFAPTAYGALYWVAFAAGLGWTLLLWARAAPLSSVLDDEIGHFVVARDAWSHPELILNVWGRAGTTLAFMLPAAATSSVSFSLHMKRSRVATAVERLSSPACRR